MHQQRRPDHVAHGEILASIGDVTPTVNEATKGKSGPDYVRARDAVVASIEKQACQGHETVNRCQVISLYDGGQYKLYTYRKYSDVRLVFAVEFATAFFGGDPDNFNFPRYDLDFSFLRLYENGAPVSTPEHLRWNSSAPKDGDPVFVAGNPGGTDRQLTAAQLLTMRDVIRPPLLMQLSELRGRYSRFAEESAEHARIVTRSLFGIENTLKALRGAQLALLEPSLIESRSVGGNRARASGTRRAEHPAFLPRGACRRRLAALPLRAHAGARFGRTREAQRRTLARI